MKVSDKQLIAMHGWMETQMDPDDELMEEIFRASGSVSEKAVREALQAAENAMAGTAWDADDERAYNQLSKRV